MHTWQDSYLVGKSTYIIMFDFVAILQEVIGTVSYIRYVQNPKQPKYWNGSVACYRCNRICRRLERER